MIEVSIRCDHEHATRAKEGKPSNGWCHSAAGDYLVADRDLNADTACAKARAAARANGWRQTKINTNGARGWLCPPCYARAYPGGTT